ncbi:conserved hypothetical protein [Ricinus communis]|uniref:Uncharacterized protein n=1 Tax=Ricinus communis TaxID=3988 RepID=B9TBY6_RICCO|nr:conserved hypothetical protein [Ricinus communis]
MDAGGVGMLAHQGSSDQFFTVGGIARERFAHLREHAAQALVDPHQRLVQADQFLGGDGAGFVRRHRQVDVIGEVIAEERVRMGVGIRLQALVVAEVAQFLVDVEHRAVLGEVDVAGDVGQALGEVVAAAHEQLVPAQLPQLGAAEHHGGQLADVVAQVEHHVAMHVDAGHDAAGLEGAARLHAHVGDVDHLRGREHQLDVRRRLERGHHALDAERVQQVIVVQRLDELALAGVEGRQHVLLAHRGRALVDHAREALADLLDLLGRAVVADQDLGVRVGLADGRAQAHLEVRRLVRGDDDAN